MYAILEIGSNAIKALIYSHNSINADKVYQIKYMSNIEISQNPSNDVIINKTNQDSCIDNPEILKNIIKQNYSFFNYIEKVIVIFNNFNIKPENIYCIATEILRSEWGGKIAEHLKIKYKLNVNILSGEEEAKISAYGVIFGINNANGLMLDLGGGSLEVAMIENKNASLYMSFPFGIKTLNGKLITYKQVLSIIEENQISQKQIKSFYLSGGCFRLIAKKYLDYIKSSIKNIHNLEINTLDFLSFVQKIKYNTSDPKIRPGKNKIIEYNGISILEALALKYKPNYIVISNYSLQEGILYDRLTQEDKDKNFALEQVKKITGITLSKLNKESYYKNILPYINNIFKIEDFLEIIIIFLRYANHFDAAIKSQIITQIILFSNINLSHREKYFVAIIVFVAINGGISNYLKNISKTLTKDEFSEAYILGLIFFCIYNIDGTFNVSASFEFQIVKKHILTVNKKIPSLIFEKIQKILKEIYLVNRAIKDKQFSYTLRIKDQS